MKRRGGVVRRVGIQSGSCYDCAGTRSLRSMPWQKTSAAITPVTAKRRLMAGVFAGSVIWLVTLWSIVPEWPDTHSSDYRSYYLPVAQSLLEGRGLTQENGTFADRYPPGYPLVLAAAMAASQHAGLSTDAAALLLNILCYGGATVLIYSASTNLFGPWLALGAVFVWLGYPLGFALFSIALSEPVFCVLLFGSVAAQVSSLHRSSPWRAMLVAGGLLGAAILVRPIALPVPLLCAAAWCLVHFRNPPSARWLPALALLAATAGVMSPWIGYARYHSGRWILASTGGLPSVRDGLTFAVNFDKEYRKEIPIPAQAREVSLAFAANYRDLKSMGQVSEVLRQQWEARPVGVVQLIGVKSLRAWYGTDSGSREQLLLAIQLPFLAILSWAAVRSFSSGAHRRSAALIIIACVLGFWAATVMVLSIARYMTPAVGLLCVLAPAVLGERQVTAFRTREAG